jgi:hypothetical protein
MFYAQARKLLLFGSTLLATLALLLALTQPIFAQEYDCGSYGSGAYSNNEQCVPAGSTGDNESDAGGGLSNTGQALAIVIPAVMIAGGGIILYRLTRKSHQDRSKTDPTS